MIAVRPDASEEGFTLVELLVSLSIMALLSVMLAVALGGRKDAWVRLERGAATAETVEAAQTVLADRIRRIWPATTYMSRTPGPAFDGGSDQMTFLAPALQAEGRGPLRRYRLSVDVGGDLVLDSVSDVALDQERWSERQVLLQGVQAIDLAYFASAPGQPAGWLPQWRRLPTMPALIRVRLTFAGTNHRRWPDLMAHPMADIDDQCRLVVGTGGCSAR